MSCPRRRRSHRVRIARAWALCALAAATLAATAAPGTGSTSDVTVTFDVLTATTLDVGSCGSGTAATDFGTVQPGTSLVTAGCTVTFGSPNGETYLRAFQSDLRDGAMYRPFDDDLDTGFGAAGTYSLDQSPGQTDKFWNAIQLRNGDIQLLGATNPGGSDEHTMLIRLKPDGTPRTSFGTNGVVVENLNVGGGDLAWSAAPSGSDAVYVGVSMPSGTWGVGRWLADGSRDTTWGGGDGWAELPDDQMPRSMAVTADGRIYVGGTDFWPTWDCAVTRFLPNGTLDTTYGTGGTVHVFPNGTYCDGMGVQRDGTVLLAAISGDDAGIVQLAPDGVVDTDFLGGVWTGDLDGASDTGLTEARPAPDGTWILGGYADGVGLVVRMRRDGSMINSFDGNGAKRLTSALDNGVRAIEWVDGRIVAGGVYGNSEVHRLLPSGAHDTTFSDDGIFDPAAPATMEDNGLLLMGDGRLLIYGDNASSTVGQAIMLDSVTIPDHANGTADWNDGSGMFGMCLSSVGADTVALRPTGPCTPVDHASWTAVPSHDGLDGIPVVAMANDSSNTSTATIHFGVRVPSGQAQGSYVAPITLEVVQAYAL